MSDNSAEDALIIEDAGKSAEQGPNATPAPESAMSKVRGAIDAKTSKVDGRKLAGLGVAVGIGSAAIVAALLYANRGKSDQGKKS
jgi:hypothetical protein